jgi:hypothetical protein
VLWANDKTVTSWITCTEPCCRRLPGVKWTYCGPSVSGPVGRFSVLLSLVTGPLHLAAQALAVPLLRVLATLTAALVWANISTTHASGQESSISDPPKIAVGNPRNECNNVKISQLQQQFNIGQHADILSALEAEAKPCARSARYDALLSVVLEDRGEATAGARCKGEEHCDQP